MRLSRTRWAMLLLAATLVLLAVNEFRPVAGVLPEQTIPSSMGGGDASAIPWPAQAQAAIGAVGSGVIASTPNAAPRPIASVAKVMTVIVTLEEKPLEKGQTGPVLTVSSDDVTEYDQEKSNGESVVAVQAGEQLTEYEALQSVLIPSANNIAGMLARWASGSVEAHVGRMNRRARALGLSRTKFVDVSGISPGTVSTPADLVRLGEEAMKQPVLADIVSQAQATLPVAGTVYNVNYALGQEHIIGIKTGNVQEEGAVYLFASNEQLASGGTATILGAVQGLPTLDLAFTAARTLLVAARSALKPVHVVSRDQAVGRYAPPWGGGSDVVAAADLDILVWPGTVVRTALRGRGIAGELPAGSSAGTLHVTARDATIDVPVTNADPLPAPSRLARLVRFTW